MNSSVQPPSLEQLLYLIPAYLDDPDGRVFLHLQPWHDRRGWNAFYGAVDEFGMGVHPFFRADGKNPVEALLNLNGMLKMANWSLEPDPNGQVEEESREPKTLGEETPDKPARGDLPSIG
jgi:hypothetical protein